VALDFSALTAGVAINLAPGAYSSAGKIAAGASALANLTTSFDATIENVIGTAQADALLGNAAGNVLAGGGGDDTINGGAGVDMATYAGPRAAYAVAITPQQVTVSGGADGADTLANVERVQFSDTKVALDLGGSAGQVAKLLGVCFGVASLTNKQYVGIGLSLLDSGTTYEQLAALAVGAAGASTPDAVVGLLWTNLFGSAPTTEQAAPYVAMLGGTMTVGALTVLAADLELNTNHINLVGLSGTGLEYGS
jgi:serralysin